MENLNIRLMKADITQHVIRSRNSSLGVERGERPTFSNGSYLKITGSVSDLFPNYDFIELIENNEPHYLDKIKIIINLADDKEASDEIPRAYFLNNSYNDLDIFFDEKELCVMGITWNKQRFNQANQLLRDQFTTISLSFFRKLTNAEFEKKQEDGSKILGVDEFEQLEITFPDRVINGEKKRVLSIEGGYDLMVSRVDLSSSIPKFLDKSEWLEDVESIKDLQAEQEWDRQLAEDEAAEAKNRLFDVLPASTNKPDTELKSIYRILIVIAIFLLVIIFKL